jgi:sigma-E factor negative regulatory protein RseB
MFRPLSLLACLFVAAPSSASENPEELSHFWQRVEAAQHALGVRGTLIYQSGNDMQVLKLVPSGLDNERFARRIEWDAESFRNGLGESVPRLTWQPLGTAQAGFSRIVQSYQVQTLPAVQQEGRRLIALSFSPRDGWRYGQTLWIDQDSGLVLRSAIHQGGQILAQSMLVSVNLDQAAVSGNTRTTESLALPNLPGAPEGFALSATSLVGESRQWVLSDGLTIVSVFVEPVIGAGQRGEEQRGALYSIADVQAERQLVALGAVPRQSLRRMLSAVATLPP